MPNQSQRWKDVAGGIRQEVSDSFVVHSPEELLPPLSWPFYWGLLGTWYSWLNLGAIAEGLINGPDWTNLSHRLLFSLQLPVAQLRIGPLQARPQRRELFKPT